ncbi:hypothetical protein ACYSNU_08530 [Enterococcus sp. LJL120]
MKDSVDLKTYYLIIIPAVLVIIVAFLSPGFEYKAQFAFFIVGVSLVSLFVLNYFEGKGRKEQPQQQSPTEESDEASGTPEKETTADTESAEKNAVEATVADKEIEVQAAESTEVQTENEQSKDETQVQSKDETQVYSKEETSSETK